MLHFSLEAEDALIVRQVLEAALVDLRREIWHTDNREFSDRLKERAAALLRAAEELSAAAVPAM